MSVFDAMLNPQILALSSPKYTSSTLVAPLIAEDKREKPTPRNLTDWVPCFALGVGEFKNTDPNNNFYTGDLNEVHDTSVSQLGADAINKPSDVSYGSILVVRTGYEYTFQMVVDAVNIGAYVRHRYNSNWTAWKAL